MPHRPPCGLAIIIIPHPNSLDGLSHPPARKQQRVRMYNRIYYTTSDNKADILQGKWMKTILCLLLNSYFISYFRIARPLPSTDLDLEVQNREFVQCLNMGRSHWIIVVWCRHLKWRYHEHAVLMQHSRLIPHFLPPREWSTPLDKVRSSLFNLYNMTQQKDMPECSQCKEWLHTDCDRILKTVYMAEKITCTLYHCQPLSAVLLMVPWGLPLDSNPSMVGKLQYWLPSWLWMNKRTTCPLLLLLDGHSTHNPASILERIKVLRVIYLCRKCGNQQDEAVDLHPGSETMKVVESCARTEQHGRALPARSQVNPPVTVPKWCMAFKMIQVLRPRQWICVVTEMCETGTSCEFNCIVAFLWTKPRFWWSESVVTAGC